MSTRGILAVYTSGDGKPERLSGRPWRGVYHHWDSYPSGLGQHLLGRVTAAHGDVASVVRALIDEAPTGWSTCFGRTPEKYPEDDSGPAVAPGNLGFTNYVYVFDVAARRLDLFERDSEQDAARSDSITFSEGGEPGARAFALSADEKVDEAPLPGKRLEPEGLDAILLSLPAVDLPTASLKWVKSEETPAGWLEVIVREVQWDDTGGITGVIEQGWTLVPPGARNEPKRVENCLRALVQVLLARPKLLNVLGLISLDPLVRSGARQQATFERLFHFYAPGVERE